MTTKNIARWTAIGALFLIPFLSLYVSNGLYFPFITGKNFLFRALVEIAAAAWLVLISCDKAYRPRFSWTLIWYKALVVWMILADALAVNPHKAFWSNYERMDGWVTLVHVFILFVVMAGVFSAEKLWRKWWLAFIAGNALVSLYGLLQLAGLAQIHQGSTRIDATIGNAEYLAGYLLFAIAVTLWQAFETRAKDKAWLRYGLFALAAVQTVILFETGTRGTAVGLVVGAIFGCVLWVIEAGKQGRKAAGAVLAIIAVLIGGLFVTQNSAFIKSHDSVGRLTSVFHLKSALGARTAIWGMAIEGIKAKPVTGWGQEGFNYVFNQYYEPSLYAQEPWFDRAHDVFLDWAIAGGIPALLFFVLALLSAAYALYKAPVSRYERVLLLSALVGYSVQGLAVFDNLFTYIPLVAILAMAHSASSRPLKYLEGVGTVNDTKLDTLIGPAALVIGGVLLWFVNVPSVLAGSNLIQALTPTNSADARLEYFKKAIGNDGLAHQEITEQLLSFASQTAADNSLTQDVRQGIVGYAVQEIEAELARAPQDARLHLQYALFLRSIGAVSLAQKQSTIARTLSPEKQNVLFEQGIESFQLGQYAAAQEYFTQAYKLDTDDTDAIGYIAGAMVANKNVAGAKLLLQQTFGTTTVNHPMLLLAYYQIGDWSDLIDVVRLKAATTHASSDEYQLAAALSQGGRRDEAIAQIRATITEHPESEAEGTSLLQQLGVTAP